jgi:hypothetical protein
MSVVSIKVSDSILEDLKLLKKIKKSHSYGVLINELVHKELLKTHAFSADGYLPIGSVVKYRKNVLVITHIVDMKVIFNDHSYVLNEGGYCWELELLTNCVEDYDEGPVSE